MSEVLGLDHTGQHRVVGRHDLARLGQPAFGLIRFARPPRGNGPDQGQLSSNGREVQACRDRWRPSLLESRQTRLRLSHVGFGLLRGRTQHQRPGQPHAQVGLQTAQRGWRGLAPGAQLADFPAAQQRFGVRADLVCEGHKRGIGDGLLLVLVSSWGHAAIMA